MRIVYVKGDHFTNELVQAIMNSSTHEFKKKYREADILLVDDIQFIAGKDATQEEFFHTFNDLFEYHKQIVLASDRTPNDMPTLEERLKGRFGEGVMVPIVSPNQETRKSIIKDKAQKLGLNLSEECVDYTSARLRDSVRQIEGGLKKLRAYRDLSGMELTLENIERTIDDLQTAEKTLTITPDLVVRYVCKYYGIDEKQLKSQLRSRNVALPRQIAMYMIRHLTKMSFPNLGKYFDKDQATVQHGVRKIEMELRNGNTQLESIIRDIQLAIDGSV
jgi:chromosomal replication initiator protein